MRPVLIFADMKKSTIWIISIVMGLSFLALFYWQMRYFNEMYVMRKEQFDESVWRSLNQVSRRLELDETWQELEKEIMKTAGAADDDADAAAPFAGTVDTLLHRLPVSSPLHTLKMPPRSVGAGPDAAETMPDASTSNPDEVRNRYEHQRALLDEVVRALVSRASNEPLHERINYKELDLTLRDELQKNGVNLTYHFRVTTRDGREIYRCSDYDKTGEENAYTQRLFPNAPPSQMGVVYVHFPQKSKYLFAGVRYMMPAIIFTVVLLLTFVYTIYITFRQKRLTEIKNDFINNMTHEFKTPISTISLAAQMLNDPAVGKSEAMFSHVSRIINDETKRLRFQVEKVLQMSMFERSRVTFKRRETDVNSLLAGVVDTFRLKVESSGGSITTNLQAAEPTIFVDEMHFTNVIFNLMDNAVKYKRDDVPLHLDLATRNEGNKVVITLADNGIGIRRDDLKKIFIKFYRVHTGNRHDVKGFGLGLAYVKNVIDMLKGTITAESELGKGTTFIITLPIIKT